MFMWQTKQLDNVQKPASIQPDYGSNDLQLGSETSKANKSVELTASHSPCSKEATSSLPPFDHSAASDTKMSKTQPDKVQKSASIQPDFISNDLQLESEESQPNKSVDLSANHSPCSKERCLSLLPPLKSATKMSQKQPDNVQKPGAIQPDHVRIDFQLDRDISQLNNSVNLPINQSPCSEEDASILSASKCCTAGDKTLSPQQYAENSRKRKRSSNDEKDSMKKGRKEIRRTIRFIDLHEKTKEAVVAEQERGRRVEDHQKYVSVL